MILSILPRELKPIFSYKKRLGDNNDGGYLVSYESVIKSDCLISFGLEENWSFEFDFTKENNLDVYCFDASVNRKYFRNKLFKTFFRFDKPQFFLKSFQNYLNYKSFFDNPSHTHIYKYISFDRYPDNISFESLKKNFLNKFNNIFFKIDIEGAEYRILNELINIKEKISSIVIEFHDVDLNINKILDFKKKLNIPIININANNNGFLSKSKIPTVIEVTFAQPDLINNFNDSNSINNVLLEEFFIEYT